MESKTFRLGDTELAALERLSHERELSQTDVIREALARFLNAHDREREREKFGARLAMRTYKMLEEALAGGLPEGPQTWRPDPSTDDIVLTVGGTEFRLENDGGWRVSRLVGDEYAEGVIEDGQIKWTRRIQRHGTA